MVRGKNGRSASRREPSSRKVRQRARRGASRRRASKIIRNQTLQPRKGHENIEFILNFLANAERDYLLLAEIDQLKELEQLLGAATSDQLFACVFPTKDIDEFSDQYGKPLSFIHDSRSSHFRYHTIFCCARKVYDMLTSSYYVDHLDEDGTEKERFAAYSSLFVTARTVAKPTTSTCSLSEYLAIRKGRRANVS